MIIIGASEFYCRILRFMCGWDEVMVYEPMRIDNIYSWFECVHIWRLFNTFASYYLLDLLIGVVRV